MKKVVIVMMVVGVVLAAAGAAYADLIQEDFGGYPVGPGVPTGWFEGYVDGPGATWEIVDLPDGNRVLKGVSGNPAVGGGSGASGPDNVTGWFVENFDMQVSLMIESGDGGGIAIGQFDGLAWTGNAYYVEVSPPRHFVALYETGLSVRDQALGAVWAPTVSYNNWYDLRMVSTGTTFQVWFRPKSSAPWQDSEKIIEVPQDLLHPGHKSYVDGFAGCWTQKWAGPSTVLFDNFRLQAAPFPGAEDFSDNFADATFSRANWSQDWCTLGFPTLDGSQVARITTQGRNGGIALGQGKQYYSHNFILRTSMYVDQSFCGGVGWAWEGTETTDTDYHIEIERHPAGTVPGVVDDNFDDGVLDPSRWQLMASSSATLEEHDGRLIVSITADPSDEFMVGAVSSTWCLSGSFDVQVDFELLNWPVPNGFAMGLLVSGDPLSATFPYSSVGRTSTVGGEIYSAGFLAPDLTSRPAVGVTPTSDTSGTLRFVRTVGAGGAVMAAYRWDASSSSWVLMGSDTVPSADARISFAVGRMGSGFQGSGVTVAFDNFRVNSGTAVPIPEVIALSFHEEQNSTSDEDEIGYGTYTEVAQPGVYWYTLEVTADYNNYYVWWWKRGDAKPAKPVHTVPQDVVHPGYRLANLGAVGLWQKPGRSGCFDDFSFYGTPAPSVNTPEGSNVLVQPENVPEMAITFDSVATDGTTSVEVSTSPPDGGPGGLEFQGTFYDINTTCVHSGPVTISLPYDDTGMTAEQEASLQLMHWVTANQVWEDITTSRDPVNNVITGATTSLSVFGIAFGIATLPVFQGFLQPINMPPSAMSVFKQKSTIPVKFRLLDAATGAPVPNVVATIWGERIAAGAPSGVNEPVYSTQPDGGNAFRYDPTSGQYIFNLSTKSLTSGTVYRIHARIMGGLMDRWVDVAVK